MTMRKGSDTDYDKGKLSVVICLDRTTILNNLLSVRSCNKSITFMYRYDNVTLIPLVLQLGLRIGPIQRMGAN
jgi:hypothetical protein